MKDIVLIIRKRIESLSFGGGVRIPLRSATVVKVSSSVRKTVACLLLTGLSLVTGCDWQISQETKDLSNFQTFSFVSTEAGDPSYLSIEAQEDGTYEFTVGEWNAEQGLVVYGQSQEMTADQISRMNDLFSQVILVTHVYVGGTEVPADTRVTLRWDDLTASSLAADLTIIGRPPHMLSIANTVTFVDQDSLNQIREFIRGLAGVEASL